MNNTICIYHGNCADGFASAWIVNKFVNNIEFHAGFYGDPIPDVKDKDVIIADFSYKRPVMINIIELAKSVLIIDHHTSAQDDLKDLDKYSNVKMIFDMKHSGCMLTWNYFFPSVEPPQLLKHIEDRDLWIFQYPDTKYVSTALFSYEYDFAIWTELMNTSIGHLINEGIILDRKHMKDIHELIKRTQREVEIEGFKVPIANLPYTMCSDAGAILAKDKPFSITYYDAIDGRVFSLRSSENGEDVSKIAVKFGGGGHKHAAGFKLSYLDKTII